MDATGNHAAQIETSVSRVEALALLLVRRLRLITFDEFLDPGGIRFAMTVTRQRIGATRRFDQNVRPKQPGLNMNRGDLLHTDAHFVPAEPGSLVPHHRLVADFDDRGE